MDWLESTGRNLAVEIHDARLESMEWAGDDLTLLLAEASIFRSDGRPGHDAGSVWRQSVAIRFTGASVEGVISSLPIDLGDGTFRSGDAVEQNCISTDRVYEGPIRFWFLAMDGNAWTIVARRAELTRLGEPEWICSWPDP